MKFFRFLYIFAALVFFSIPFWIFKTFGEGITTEQLIFHILSGKDGMDGTDPTITKSFAKYVLIKPFLVSVGICVSLYLYEKNFFLHRLRYLASKLFEFSKKFINSYLISSNKLYAILLILSIAFFSLKLGVPKYIFSFFGGDYFSLVYKDPKKVKIISPEKKKNIILIYVESLEENLVRADFYGKNLIKEIEAVDGEVASIRPAPGTTWSIAGMISSQCSFPLKPYYGNDLNQKKSVLPGAICLGDVLSGYGYSQYFLVGPDLKFSGMDKFYRSHGYQYSIGRDEWRAKGLSPALFTGWGGGLHDDTLLDEAEKIVKENVTNKTPYNLTIITTDNHAPHGIPSPRCSAEERATSFKGTFECTSRLINKFVSNLKAKDFLKDTVVVIMGDHPFMNPPEMNALFPEPRNVFFKITNPAMTLKRNTLTHFDVAPTIFDALGMLDSADEKRFGLGLSLYGSMNDYEGLLQSVTSKKILNHSPAYDAFWIAK